jgi:Zn-dependent protease with chaperone function
MESSSQVFSSDGVESSVAVWTSAQRESFFEAIARNRRAAVRVSLVGWLCGALITAILAVLTAPLLLGAIVLAVDLLNFARPLPDPVALATRWLRAQAAGKGTLSPMQWVEVLVAVSLPGTALIVCAMLLLRRALGRAITLESTDTPTRPPDMTRLGEQRLSNVAQEMAIAAQLPAPDVRIADSGEANAVILGDGQLTLIATRGLVEQLDRNAIEGAVAHLIGSAANGDLRIGRRFSVDVIASAILMHPGGTGRPLHALGRLAMAVISPRRMDAATLRAWLTPQRDTPAPARPSSLSSGGSLAGMATLVLMGPWMAGFFFNVACAFLVIPLLALAWRQRKYMADATAVRLTRDPDALASALERIKGDGARRLGKDPFEHLTAHLDQHPEDAARIKLLLDRTGGALPATLERFQSDPRFSGAITAALKRREALATALAARAQSDPHVAAALAAPVPDDADTLSQASETFAPAWLAPMAAFQRAGVERMGLMVEPVPGAKPRLKRLARLGAHLHEPPERMNLVTRSVIGVIVTLTALVMAVVVGATGYVSAALSGVFTLIPALLLHALLRWLAGH